MQINTSFLFSEMENKIFRYTFSKTIICLLIKSFISKQTILIIFIYDKLFNNINKR